MAKQAQPKPETTTPKAPATSAPKPERISRGAAANRVIAELDGPTTLGALAKQADALFVAGGGKSKIKAAVWTVRRALETAESLGVVTLTKPTDLMVERVA
jgi:hypothetical protein